MSAESTHNDILDLLPGYILGALEPDEMLRVADYLAAHPELEATVTEAEEALAQMAYIAPDAQLPDYAKQRLVDRVRNATVILETPYIKPTTVPTKTPLQAQPFWTRFADLFQTVRWAVVAVIIIGLLAWNIRLQTRAVPDIAALERIAGAEGTHVSLMIDTPAAPNASGRLFIPADGTTAVMVITGLPELPAGKDYQFWFARPDNSRDSAAVFDVSPNGQALVEVPVPAVLSQYNQIWVTQEPDGGSAVPTAPHFLEGPLVQ